MAAKELKNRKSKENVTTGEPVGYLLPQAREFEQAVIGAIILEKQAFEIVENILTEEMFYDKSNALIFNAASILKQEMKPIDLLTVIEKLRHLDTLESAGGVSFVAQLSQKIISSAHLEYHCRIIKQQYLRRKFIENCQIDCKMAFDDTEDIDDIFYKHGKDLEILQEIGVGNQNIKPLCEILIESVSEMYLRKEKAEKGIQPGITTGLADLNRLTGGWQKSDLVILAARPAMGKTAMALHFAKRAAKTGTAVAMFSLEMSDVSLGNRFLLSETDVNPNDFKLGKISQEDSAKIEKAVGKMYQYPIYIDSNASVTMSYIHSRCRLLKKRGKCEMIIIDYLQLAVEKGDKNRNRENEVSKMSREAKLIAKELDVPVILLSQLNRDVDKRSNKVPVLADLRESGAIEQDADMVIFIHRPEYYDKNSKNGYGELIIAKYRNGYTGKVLFKYNESMTKIYDYDSRNQSAAMPVNNYHIPF